MTEYDRPIRESYPAAENPAESPTDISPGTRPEMLPASDGESAHEEPAESLPEEVETPPEETMSQDQRGKGLVSVPTNGGTEDLGSLFESRHTEEIQQRWHEVQASFVDDPHEALRQAGDLNDEVMRSLATALDDRKDALEREIANGDTERLRIGLRQYHQMLDQILAL